MNVQNKNSNIKNSEIWDKKAKSYSKFDGNLNEFQIRFFKILKDFDVSFKDKTLVDIRMWNWDLFTLFSRNLQNGFRCR